jgi:hypothetical protein
VKRALALVGPTDPSLDEIRHDCAEGITRAIIQRRAQLKRDLAAEEVRLKIFARRLAKQRGLAFIRIEALEQEFGG